MSGPVRPPLKTQLDNDTSENRPVNTIAFANTDFTLTNSGTKTTVALSGGGGGTIGGSIADTQVAFGSAADTIAGSANFLFTQGSNQQLQINQTSTAGLGTIALKEAGTTAGIFQYRGSTNGTNPNTIRLGTNVAGGNLLFMTDSATANMYIDSTGKVGIGTTSPTAPLHVKDSGVADMLRLESTDTGATTAPDLVLYRNAAGAANDFIGTLDFKAQDSGGNEEYYGRIVTKILDASATHAGQMLFKVAKNGSIDLDDADIKIQAGTGIIFNEAGFSDMDFRVETDTQTHALFVDASLNRVGIGTSSPTSLLHVEGEVTIGDDTAIGSSTSGILSVNGSTALATFRASNVSSGDQVCGIRIFSDNFRSRGMMIGALDVTLGTETEQYLFGTQYAKSGSAGISASPENGGTEYITCYGLGASGSSVAINDDNINMDFKVGAETSGHLIWADAGRDAVGIKGQPSTGLADNNPVLQVDGSISGKVPIIVTSSATSITLTNDQMSGHVLWFGTTSNVTITLPDGVTGDHIKVIMPSGDVEFQPTPSGQINGGVAGASISRNSAQNEILEFICVAANKWYLNNP